MSLTSCAGAAAQVWQRHVPARGGHAARVGGACDAGGGAHDGAARPRRGPVPRV